MKQILKYPAAVLFGIFILTFFLVDVLNEDRYMSEFENMKLQQKPSFSWSDFADGSFGNNYVTYINHQILGRDNWISLKAAADMGLPADATECAGAGVPAVYAGVGRAVGGGCLG